MTAAMKAELDTTFREMIVALQATESPLSIAVVGDPVVSAVVVFSGPDTVEYLRAIAQQTQRIKARQMADDLIANL